MPGMGEHGGDNRDKQIHQIRLVPLDVTDHSRAGRADVGTVRPIVDNIRRLLRHMVSSDRGLRHVGKTELSQRRSQTLLLPIAEHGCK